MAITFDGPNKLMILSSGTIVLNVPDLYSRWKDWVQLSDNSKYIPAFYTSESRAIGGDPIDLAAGTSIPFYDYLTNGWRIRPHEANHTLVVTGGVLLVDGGGDPFVNTLGSFTVRINYQQPVQAITVATGGGGGASASDIWQRVIENSLTAEQLLRILVAGISGKSTGVGTTHKTYKSVTGAKDRITVDFDAQGNRDTVTLDGT